MEIGGEDVGKVKGGEGGQERKDVVLTERASKAYTGATCENQSGPRQTQSSDLARLTEWCWTNFFHVSSELARPISLGAWHLAPSTVQQRVAGPALLRRWGQGPGCGGRAQTEPTEHSSSPRSVWHAGSGEQGCPLPWHRPVKASEKKRHLLSTLVGRVSPFQSLLTIYANIWSRHSQEKPNTPVSRLAKRAGKKHNAPFDADAISIHQAGITKHTTLLRSAASTFRFLPMRDTGSP